MKLAVTLSKVINHFFSGLLPALTRVSDPRNASYITYSVKEKTRSLLVRADIMPFKINIYQSRQKYYVHRSYAPHERGDFIQTMKTSHGGNLSDRKNIKDSIRFRYVH